MKIRDVFAVLAFVAAIGAFTVGGCKSRGDIDVPTGQYTTTVVTPHGVTYAASAFIDLIGTSMTFFLSSEPLSVTARGTLEADNTFSATADLLDTTGTSGTEYALVNLTFTEDRSRYNGEVIVDEGNYVLAGNKV